MSGEGNLSDKSSKIERRLGCSSDQVIDMPLPGLNIKTKKDKKRFINPYTPRSCLGVQRTEVLKTTTTLCFYER